MARTFGIQHPAIKDLLLREPYRFKFFQATRLFNLWNKNDQAILDKKEAPFKLLFRTPLSLSFPASEIADLKFDPQDPDPRTFEMVVAFMGLVGPMGVLPQHYTENLIHRAILQKESAAHAFLDLFSHHMVQLFIKTWEKYRWWVLYEQSRNTEQKTYLLSFAGLGTPGLQDRFTEPPHAAIVDEQFIYYSGILRQGPKSATILQAILSDYFATQVDIQQCSGQWLFIPPHLTTQLGQQQNNLGTQAVVGYKSWDWQSSSRIRIGPLSYKVYREFLPGGRHFIRAINLIELFVGKGMDFQMQLILDKHEVPRCTLSSKAEDAKRLGLDTWLPHKKLNYDPDNALFAGHA